MEAMNYLKAYLHILSLFCIGMTLAIAMLASHRIYTFWVPLNKKSLRHLPIILWMMIINYLIQIDYGFDYIREPISIVVIPWFVLWLIVVSGVRSQILNRGLLLFRLFRGSNTLSTGTHVVSIRRPTISDIPWKSFCTSMPFIALILSYMCYANLVLLYRSYDSFQYFLQTDQSLNGHITILLLLAFVMVELIPEITVCFSVTNVRKIFSCLFFVSMGIIYYLEAFPDNIFLFLDNKKFVNLIYNFMPYFSIFGFEINHLDIAPQYSSVLYGMLMTIYYITWLFSPSILKYSLIFEKLNQVQFCLLVTVISLAVAAFYAIFASAELQPWAVDKPVKENQRNMQEEVNLTAV
ncbi:probable vesicular glutamate transporter eat-4 isoform X2 [Metopolophium dirhodum]|nr:probable vesicular glutamate transporter eat-4 isoform X2 [Metopolophium dirhodum]XP_060871215.1 probable vesicular glutamate transporter eat-4 isoform X2 [Metopolophium dirhodum]